MLKVFKLTYEFHDENRNLIEALHDKGRGYGIVAINFNKLTFGLPLRSNLKHKYGYVLDEAYKFDEEDNKYKLTKRGIDYTKAVLIRDKKREIGKPFYVPYEQKEVLIHKRKVIINQFNKYVNEYIYAIQNNAINTLNHLKYKRSTLQNYHKELGIE